MRTAAASAAVLLMAFLGLACAGDPIAPGASELAYRESVAMLQYTPASALTLLGATLVQDRQARAALAKLPSKPVDKLPAVLEHALLASSPVKQKVPQLNAQQAGTSKSFQVALRLNRKALSLAQVIATQDRAKEISRLLAVVLRKVALPAQELGLQAQIPMDAATNLFTRALGRSGVLALAPNASGI